MSMPLPASIFLMSIGGSEWAIIILLCLVLLFGSKKLPEISRTLGKAAAEYEKARQLFGKEMNNAMNMMENHSTGIIGPHITGPVRSDREKLELIAKSLNIDYINKTDDQLRSLISEKLQDGL
jgi:sec-independent protein translocase protein TatA